jgi:hypothetical protein
MRFATVRFLKASVDDWRQLGTVQPSNIEAVLTWILIFVEIFVHGKIIGEDVSLEDLQVMLDI